MKDAKDIVIEKKFDPENPTAHLPTPKEGYEYIEISSFGDSEPKYILVKSS